MESCDTFHPTKRCSFEQLVLLDCADMAVLWHDVAQLMQRNGVHDVHFEAKAADSGSLVLRAYHGKVRPDFARMGEDTVCSSCHPELPLSKLLKVLPPPPGHTDPLDAIPNSALLLADTGHSRVWLDGKGRSMVIVTPVRHVERLTELSADESRALWADLGTQLRRLLPDDPKRCIKSIAINHGSRQNHPHLHIKITLRDKVYKALLKDKLTAEQRRMRDAMRAAVSQAKREGRMGLARKKKLLEAQRTGTGTLPQ